MENQSQRDRVLEIMNYRSVLPGEGDRANDINTPGLGNMSFLKYIKKLLALKLTKSLFKYKNS